MFLSISGVTFPQYFKAESMSLEKLLMLHFAQVLHGHLAMELL
jgi:hypothetical protein